MAVSYTHLDSIGKYETIQMANTARHTINAEVYTSPVEDVYKRQVMAGPLLKSLAPCITFLFTSPGRSPKS